MPFTKIDNDQLKDLTLKNNKIATNADIEQSKIQDLVSDLAAINTSLAGKLEKAGDTMTGSLILAGDPTLNLEASTKQYVDTRLLKSGDTMTGFLTLNANPTNGLHAVTKQYADTFLSLSGGTLTGSLNLVADPIQPLEAATKQYVDNLLSENIPLNYFSGYGFIYTGSNTSFEVKPGTVIDDTNSFAIISGSNILVDLTTTGINALDAGVLQSNQIYFVWAIKEADPGTNVAILCSLSATSPAMPVGYDKKRRIGSFLTNGSTQIHPFKEIIYGNTKQVYYTPVSILTTANDQSIPANYNVLVNTKIPSTASLGIFDAYVVSDVTPNNTNDITGTFATLGTPLDTQVTVDTVNRVAKMNGPLGELKLRINTNGYIYASTTNANSLILDVIGYVEEL
jgi:hypothetical protein